MKHKDFDDVCAVKKNPRYDDKEVDELETSGRETQGKPHEKIGEHIFSYTR